MAFSSEQALKFLLIADKRAKLAHTFLFSGPEFSGKRRLAQDFFKTINAVPNALGHPDYHWIEPESKARRILVDQIRELEASLQMRANVARFKFGVVVDADRLMPQAANAFLKTLEEPPDNSILILLTTLPEALLETIRSRCVQVVLRLTGPPVLEPEAGLLLDALAEFFDTESFSVAGALGLARRFEEALANARSRIEAEHAALLERERDIYKNTTDGKWLDQVEDRLSVLTESRYLQARSLLLLRLQEWLGDAVRQAEGAADLDLPTYQNKTAAAARRLPLEELLDRMSAIELLHEHFSRNVQESLAVEVAFLKTFGPRRETKIHK
jgi:DNA polymerase III subunit delta'